MGSSWPRYVTKSGDLPVTSGLSTLLRVTVSLPFPWIQRAGRPVQILAQAETRTMLSQMAPGLLCPEGCRNLSLSRNFGHNSTLSVSALLETGFNSVYSQRLEDRVSDCLWILYTENFGPVTALGSFGN